jgi:pantoate--beta-alanine ligase
MRTFQAVSPLRTYLRTVRAEGKTIGFVPTMGALHEGHVSLFRRAKSDCELVVVSIFVNPMQFGPNEDFAAYPRDLNQDFQLASAAGVDALFHPSVEEMYGPGFQTVVDVPELSSLLEGAHRPGHFTGVTTIVAKLLNIVRPNRAYFGQKDYQQCLIIERMVRDLNFLTDIVPMPTIREPDGLALSSRNVYLSEEERQAASILYRALKRAEELVQDGAVDPRAVRSELEALIASEPLAATDYAALLHPETLQPAATLADAVTLVALAVRIGKTRLIDNVLIAPPGVPIPRHRTGKS